MNSDYYRDESVTLLLGDSLEVARTLTDGSADCIVTSPPYFGLRDYGNDGQYGAEASPAEYVETMRALFAELRRALADDGTLWLNLGDSYQSAGGMGGVGPNAKVGSTKRQASGRTRPTSGMPNKNLLGIPWRVALALQDDGWILRNDIIWHKPNAMPQSVTDRLSSRHEHVFMLSKSQRYWFDLDAVRIPTSQPDRVRRDQVGGNKAHTTQHSPGGIFEGATTRNPGDVWDITTQPFPGAHFAVFPPALPERCILAGCKPGGVVLDPFSGSGTTGMAATKHGRKYVGIDINSDYHDLALRTRFAQPGFNFGSAV